MDDGSIIKRRNRIRDLSFSIPPSISSYPSLPPSPPSPIRESSLSFYERLMNINPSTPTHSSQPNSTSTSNQEQRGSHTGSNSASAITTRSGRHLHLLAPLNNRLYNSNNIDSGSTGRQPVPSIVIPDNPYRRDPAHGQTPSHPISPFPNSLYPTRYDQSIPIHIGGFGYVHNGDYEERLLRSPHPPLTASLRPNGDYRPGSSSSSSNLNLWPPPLPSISLTPTAGVYSGVHSRANSGTSVHSNGSVYRSSPFNEHTVPIPNNSYRSDHSTLQQPIYTHNQTYLPPIHVLNGQFRNSPVTIPPPLRFNYSQSPPPPSVSSQAYSDTMPPRRKPPPANTNGTPATVSSTTSSRRKPALKGYHTEGTYDSIGQHREVIVIDDSESPAHAAKNAPLTRKRTRAQVAAEQAARESQMNGYPMNGTSSTASSVKKRKVDEASEAPSLKKVKQKVSVRLQSANLLVILISDQRILLSRSSGQSTACTSRSFDAIRRCRRSLYSQTGRLDRS